jgi:hypothetical protein
VELKVLKGVKIALLLVGRWWCWIKPTLSVTNVPTPFLDFSFWAYMWLLVNGSQRLEDTIITSAPDGSSTSERSKKQEVAGQEVCFTFYIVFLYAPHAVSCYLDII